MGVVAQAAGMAALNLRNAVLLRKVQDLAERDALTGAANRRSFQASLERVIEANTERRDRVAGRPVHRPRRLQGHQRHPGPRRRRRAPGRRDRADRRAGPRRRRRGPARRRRVRDPHRGPARPPARAGDGRAPRPRAPGAVPARRPVRLDLGVSIGVAGARDAVEGAADMVRNADVAMYMAKAGGKAGFQVFDPGMHQAVRDRHEMAMDLQHAVELDQLHLRYQPIIDLETGRLPGVEALVRWQHPERGPRRRRATSSRSPRSTASILPIGRWVLRRGVPPGRDWVADGRWRPRHVRVRQRLGPRGPGGRVHRRRPRGARGARRGGRTAGHRAHRDRAAAVDPDHRRDPPGPARPGDAGRDRRLRDRLLLAQPPPPVPGRRAEDRPRVHPGDGDETGDRTAALAAAIVAMARSLGIDTVAEGIETPAQADRMRAMHCTYGQGYFYARPLLPEELLQAFRDDAAQAAAAAAAAISAPAATPRSRTRAARAMVVLAGSGTTA